MKKCFLMSCLMWLLANFISFPLVRSLEENCNDGQPFLLSYLFVNSLYVSIMSPFHLLNLSVGKSKYFSRSTYGRFLHSLKFRSSSLYFFYSSSSIWPMYDGFHTELLYSTVLRTNPLYKDRNATLSLYLKFLLMIPNMLYALFTLSCMWS